MRRSAFVALAAAAAATAPLRAFGRQDDADPAVATPSAALRVLLGQGTVQGPSGPAGGFVFNGRPYRGTYSRLPDGSVVNLVDVEQYLYAVVPHEMPSSWPAAALAAQAICARTYVLQRSDPRRAYDLVPSEADQVYGGVDAETPSGRAAVDASAGTVLQFGGAFAKVAYSSCCGGHTEAASEAWAGGAEVPYLAGVACTSCGDSPNYRWNAVVPFETVSTRFASQLAQIGPLRDVRVADRDASGRARAFLLVADGGTVPIKGNLFRLGVGARVLRSLLVTGVRSGNAPQAGQALFVEGGGLGHGVGMCQWGARGMALAGHTARDILSLYFPGTQLTHD